jgi:hypothetical protein
VIFCVVPEPLAPELYDQLAAYYEDDPNVTVINVPPPSLFSPLTPSSFTSFFNLYILLTLLSLYSFYNPPHSSYTTNPYILTTPLITSYISLQTLPFSSSSYIPPLNFSYYLLFPFYSTSLLPNTYS